MTSVQEILPLEGADPCQFVVLSEDAAAHESAMVKCGGVLTRFDAELAFSFSFWRFKDLSGPASAHWAAEAVARADIILFSLQGHDLAPEILNWLESCIQLRTKTTGALAVMVGTSDSANILAFEALLFRMRYFANVLRMDFLPLVPLPGGSDIHMPDSSMLPGRPRQELVHDHWGLNE